MKRKFAFKSLLSLVMAGTLFCGSAISAFAEDIGNYEVKKPDNSTTIQTIAEHYHNDLSDKVVILSTNDTHGAILQFAYFAALKNYFKDELHAAGVLLVDSGDFSADKSSKDDLKVAKYKQEGHLSGNSKRSVELMNLAGYDYACLGNHEINSNPTSLNSLIKDASFKILDANIHTSIDLNFSANDVATFENSPVKIGLFGLDTKEIKDAVDKWNEKKDKENPKNSVDIDNALFECAENQVKELKGKGSDLVICLSHLGMEKGKAPSEKDQYVLGTSKDKKGNIKYGNRSVDVYDQVDGIDLMLDAHSHTAMIAGSKGEPIMSGQIWGNYMGITVIDNDSKTMDRYLVSDQGYETTFGTTSEERVENLTKYGASDVIEKLEEITGKDADTLFDYDYNGNSGSSKDKSSDKSGKSGKSDKDKYGKDKHGRDKHGRDKSGRGGNNKNNNRFNKRAFEYDEEDFEFEEDFEAVEDASVEASTTEENDQLTNEASDENSTQIDEQTSDDASTQDSAEASEQSSEEDNADQDDAEQNVDAEEEPAA